MSSPSNSRPAPRRKPGDGKTLEELLADSQAAAGNAVGIKCPRCGCADLRVGRTQRMIGRLKRYRYCRHCGTSVPTFERPAS